VAIVDNDSSDESRELIFAYRNAPVIMKERLSYGGYYSLPELLAAKQKIYRRLSHDWVIHHDADEILEHFRPNLTLRDAIQEADVLGYNVINFDEFVFLPSPGVDFHNKNYYHEMRRYYFFEPDRNRLNRAWKRSLLLNNVNSGGHRLSGNGIETFPQNHILRHYIALSQGHVNEKYLDRRFDVQAVKRGWHTNKLSLTEENLRLPQSNKFLFELETFDSKNFRRDIPSLTHYWGWER